MLPKSLPEGPATPEPADAAAGQGDLIRAKGERAELAASTSPIEENAFRVAGSRCTKSKMPWPPGFIPVMKVDQATGLCGGMVVASR